jgi:hypothetical protein
MPEIVPPPLAVARTRELKAKLRIPVIAAPMFLISGPDLVVAACKAGIIGCLPAPNAREIATLEAWCASIAAQSRGAAPWALNMIAHSTYARFDAELELVARHRPPLLVTALGSPARALEAVHAYGGLVFADVTSPTLARKAPSSARSANSGRDRWCFPARLPTRRVSWPPRFWARTSPTWERASSPRPRASARTRASK